MSATQVIISALGGDADNKVGEQRVFSALSGDADNKVGTKRQGPREGCIVMSLYRYRGRGQKRVGY